MVHAVPQASVAPARHSSASTIPGCCQGMDASFDKEYYIYMGWGISPLHFVTFPNLMKLSSLGLRV